jgi:hypothetical protein
VYRLDQAALMLLIDTFTGTIGLGAMHAALQWAGQSDTLAATRSGAGRLRIAGGAPALHARCRVLHARDRLGMQHLAADVPCLLVDRLWDVAVLHMGSTTPPVPAFASSLVGPAVVRNHPSNTLVREYWKLEEQGHRPRVLGVLASQLPTKPRPFDRLRQNLRKLCHSLQAQLLLPGGAGLVQLEAQLHHDRIQLHSYALSLPEERLASLLQQHLLGLWDVLHEFGLNHFGRCAAIVRLSVPLGLVYACYDAMVQRQGCRLGDISKLSSPAIAAPQPDLPAHTAGWSSSPHCLAPPRAPLPGQAVRLARLQALLEVLQAPPPVPQAASSTDMAVAAARPAPPHRLACCQAPARYQLAPPLLETAAAQPHRCMDCHRGRGSTALGLSTRLQRRRRSSLTLCSTTGCRLNCRWETYRAQQLSISFLQQLQ